MTDPCSTAVVTSEMCYFCFDVLFSHLNNSEPPQPPIFPDESYPLFVTWETGKDRKLRGCIGTFKSLELEAGLKEYAISSAIRDRRFNPITKSELNNLYVSVSILTHFEDAKDYLDWQIGVHGIRIEFNNTDGVKRIATYLPEVATEKGWNRTETVDALLRKAGYKSDITDHVRRSIQLTRYQSETVTVGYDEYQEFRNRRAA